MVVCDGDEELSKMSVRVQIFAPKYFNTPFRSRFTTERLIKTNHSISGFGDPDTSIVKTASVCNKASISAGFLLIFGPAEINK
jgi:hypothetical protein